MLTNYRCRCAEANHRTKTEAVLACFSNVKRGWQSGNWIFLRNSITRNTHETGYLYKRSNIYLIIPLNKSDSEVVSLNNSQRFGLVACLRKLTFYCLYVLHKPHNQLVNISQNHSSFKIFLKSSRRIVQHLKQDMQ